MKSRQAIAAVTLLVFLQGLFMPLGHAQEANLDLSSTERTITADHHDNFAGASIQVGDVTRTVSPTDALTPAEHMALHQVLNGGSQSLILGELGNAVGGTVHLTEQLNHAVSNLVIPAQVTAVHDFGITEAVNVTGNLTNSGNFYGYSSSSAVSTANVAASNITNNLNALISTVLPAGGLLGVNSAVANLNLNLTAVNDIMNSGIISSAGNLSLNAGGSIVNQATITAVQNIDIASAIGNIVNSGTIASSAGNINVATQNIQNMLINNTGGVMEALNGSFALAVADELAKPVVEFDGGKLIAEELHFDVGEGSLRLSLDDIGGGLFVDAGLANLTVSNGTSGMEIRELNISGDPNVEFTGNGPFSSPAVTTMGGYVDIDTSADSVNGSITFTGDIDTQAVSSGPAGDVTLNAGTFIAVQDINASGVAAGDEGGTVYLKAAQYVSTNDIDTQSAEETGGNLTIETAQWRPGAGSMISTGGGNMSLTSHEYTDLSVVIPDSASATVDSGGGTIDIKPTPGQHLIFTKAVGAGTGTLYLNGGPVNMETYSAGIFVHPGVTVSSDNTITLNVSTGGEIIGIAFQPYVGPWTTETTRTAQNAYSLQVVTDLLTDTPTGGGVAVNDQFDLIATYSQGTFVFAGKPGIQDSDRYNIQAAHAAGMTVAAGIFQQGADPEGDSINVTWTKTEIDYAIKQAKAYPGTVKELIIGNESIWGPNSTQAIIDLVSYAKTELAKDPSTKNIKVSTRQEWGVLAGVETNTDPNMRALLKTLVTSVDHVYANMYAYFDSSIASEITADPGNFKTIVQQSMTSTLTALRSAFSTKNINTEIRIGETGWPTQGSQSAQPDASIASAANAQMYYQAMHEWAAKEMIKVVMFEAYDEPQKNTSASGTSSEAYFGIWTANGVTTGAPYADKYTLNSITQKYTLPPPPKPPASHLVHNQGTIAGALLNINTPKLLNEGTLTATTGDVHIVDTSVNGSTIANMGTIHSTSGNVNIDTNNLVLGNNSMISTGSTGDINITALNGKRSSVSTVGTQISTIATLMTGGGSINFINDDNGWDFVHNTKDSLDPNQSLPLVPFTGPTGTINMLGGNVYIRSDSGVVHVDPDMKLSSDGFFLLDINQQGGIYGVAFQPYVGPYVGGIPVLFNAYTLQDVQGMLQIVAQDFQLVSTYGQGFAVDSTHGGQPYARDSNQYIIQAANAEGVKVAAGVNQWIVGGTWNLDLSKAEIDYAISQAKLYPGTVVELVITNESITDLTSAQNVLTLIEYAQTQRTAAGFDSQSMPVTTRQMWGVLGGVDNPGTGYQSTLKTILSTVDGYVYANFYPYYDAPLDGNLGPTPISESHFKSVTTAQMTADYTALQSAFTTESVSATIRVGETGWPTSGTNYPQTNAALASTQYAQWYFEAMQSWSATQSGGVPTIVFEAYDEPWKGTEPGTNSEQHFGIWTAKGSAPNAGSYTFNGATQKYTINTSTQSRLNNFGTISAAQTFISAPEVNNLGTLRATAGDIYIIDGLTGGSIVNRGLIHSVTGDIVFDTDAYGVPLTILNGPASVVRADSGTVYFGGEFTPSNIYVVGVPKNGPSDFNPFSAATADLSSPGQSILKSLPQESFGTFSAASISTPDLSGIAAFRVSQINAGIDLGKAAGAVVHTAFGDLTFTSDVDVSLGRADSSGGFIDIKAARGAVHGMSLLANGVGPDTTAKGGAVYLFALDGATLYGSIEAQGLDGAAGGKIDIAALGSGLEAFAVFAGGDGDGDPGGSIGIVATELNLFGVNNAGASIDASSYDGKGGFVSIYTRSASPFTVAGDYFQPNSIAGDIRADGHTDGGSIFLFNFGGHAVGEEGSVTANGGIGLGGRIHFQSTLLGLQPLIVKIDGLVQAKNDADNSGVVSFNGGPGIISPFGVSGATVLGGDGVIHGGKGVTAGNVNAGSGALLASPGGIVKVDPDLTIKNSFRSNPGFQLVGFEEGELSTSLASLFNSADRTRQIIDAQTARNASTISTDTVPVQQASLPVPVTIPSVPSSGGGGGGADQIETTVGPGVSSFGSAEVNHLEQHGIKVGPATSGNFLQLNQGNLLVSPAAAVVIGTMEGLVNINPGAITYVIETGNDVAVYDLHDRHVGDVKVTVGKKQISLRPGEVIVLTKKKDAEFDEVNPGKHIASRNPKRFEADGGVVAFLAEFSLPSAMNKMGVLRALIKSTDKTDRKLAKRLIKMAAIQAHIMANAGPFKTGKP